MIRRNQELWYALLAVVIVTVVYFFVSVWDNEILSASSFFGHTLGIIGFIFMLMTEFLYSLRKGSRRAARWGSMDFWLKFHIFTGLVGPYMVLLHSAWSFLGLAGVVTLLMIMIVVSGFVGRYIYTLIPRTAAGVQLGGRDLEYHLEITEVKLKRYINEHSELINALPQHLIGKPEILDSAWPLIAGRFFGEWRFNWRWWRETHGMDSGKVMELKKLLDFRRELHYQIASMLLVRRVLAVWHAIHVPLSVALFITAFVHIGATIYYITLAR